MFMQQRGKVEQGLRRKGQGRRGGRDGVGSAELVCMYVSPPPPPLKTMLGFRQWYISLIGDYKKSPAPDHKLQHTIICAPQGVEKLRLMYH